jgi:EAL and modified HD-GYP domain-containing signal transduction protein
MFGIGVITGGRKAFVNFTRDTLVNGYANIIPKSLIVVEILETVVADDEVVEACRALKRAGHLIALDDVVLGAWSTRLIELADIVKVDFAQNDPEQRARIVKTLRPRGLKLLAEKVETQEDFGQARTAGYDYFQGYFFSKPAIISGRKVPASKLNLLQLLREIHSPATDLRQVETLIKREVSLTLKLLTYMNSVAFGVRRRIESVGHAMAMLGEVGVKRWASVAILFDMGRDKPVELVVNSVIRARFGESLATAVGLGGRAPDAFFMGLFSMLDVLLGQPLPDLLARLPVAEDVREALLGGRSRLRPVLELVRAWEAVDWAEVSRLCLALALDEAAVPGLYLEAVEWGNSTRAAEQRR